MGKGLNQRGGVWNGNAGRPRVPLAGLRLDRGVGSASARLQREKEMGGQCSLDQRVVLSLRCQGEITSPGCLAVPGCHKGHL